MSTEDKIFKSKFPYTYPDKNATTGSFLLESFEHHYDKTLIVDCCSKREWTGEQLKEATVRVASGLMDKCQIKKGDVVYMMCPHSDHEIIFCMGAQLTGATVYGSTPRDGYGEHKIMCNIVQPNILVASYRMHHELVQLLADIKEVSANSDYKGRIIWIDTIDKPLDDIDDYATPIDSNNNCSVEYEELIERDNVIVYYDDLLNYKYLHYDKIKDILENQIDASKDAAFLLLTSGSTGKPKVVHQTHYTVVAGAHATMIAPRTKNKSKNRQVSQLKEELPISDNGELWYLDVNSIVAGDLPLDHGAGQDTIFVSIHKGCKLAIMRSYDTDIFWGNVSEYKITDCMASSTFAHRLLLRFKSQLEKGDKFYRSLDITSLRTLFFCGSRIGSIELCEEFMRDHPHLAIVQGYGCTEAAFISLLVRGHHVGHLDSAGYLSPGVTAKLVDPDTGELLGKNVMGELRVKSPACFLKYVGDAKMDEITKSMYDSDGFYKTGDQVYFDDEERLYVIGRYKDTLFLDEDWKILPKELEDIVEQHPLIELACIVGIADRELPSCHAPKAFIKLVPGARGYCTELGERRPDNVEEGVAIVSDKDIFDFLATKVAKPKYLRGGVRFVDEFPRNGLLNKIDRNQLRLLP